MRNFNSSAYITPVMYLFFRTVASPLSIAKYLLYERIASTKPIG